MSSFFKPLPADCIDYYGLSTTQRALMSSLAYGALDRDHYLALKSPFPIGMMDKDVAEKIPLAIGGPGQRLLAAATIEFHGSTGVGVANGVARSLTIKAEQRPGVRWDNLEAARMAQRSIINYDSQVVGGSRTEVRFDIDNRGISPQILKAPLWHIDKEPDQVVSTYENALVPPRLSPVARGYGLRIAAPDCSENVQIEFLTNTHSRSGEPHPLALQSMRLAAEANAYRELHGVVISEIGQYAQKNPEFAKRWDEFKGRQDIIDNEMRKEGLIQQARPYEVLFALNYDPHRTHRPSQPIASTFYATQMRPRG